MLNREEYIRALARIEVLCARDPEPDTDEGRELIGLVDVVLEYEQQHYPMLFTGRADDFPEPQPS